MNCKKCGAENAGWRAFCSQCGRPLGLLCQCSFPNQAGDKYCGGCGQPLNKPKGNEEHSESTRPLNAQKQFDETEIKNLINDSLLLKFGGGEQIKQDDIDSFFKE